MRKTLILCLMLFSSAVASDDVAAPNDAVASDDQEGECTLPARPSIPSGYYALPLEMEQALPEVEDYLDQLEQYQYCLVRKLEAARAEMERTVKEWNTAVNVFAAQ